MIKDLERSDHGLLIVSAIMLLAGIIMVYSSSGVIGHDRYGDPGIFVKKQIVWMFLGLILAAVFFKMPHERLKKIIPALFFISLALLFLVQVPFLGKKIGGAVRWLKFPGLPAFQPLELVKLFYVMYLAWLFSNTALSAGKQFVRAFAATLAVITGLLIQPDLGGAIIIGGLFCIMMIISGMPGR